MPQLMDHIDFLSYVIAMLLGFGNLLFLTLGYIRYKNVYLKHLWIAYLATTIMLVVYTVECFIRSYMHNAFDFYRTIVVLCMTFIISGSSFLVVKLLYENAPLWINLIIYGLSALPLIYIPAYFFLPYDASIFLSQCIFIEFYSVLGINCISFFIRFKRLDKSKAYKNFSKYFSIILSMFVIIFFIQVLFNMSFNPLPLFYSLWSILFIIYFWKNIFMVSVDRLTPANFCEHFHITDREKDIIDLIVQGKANKTIGGHLFISEKTVKNHIYNIYKKLGINSRFELMGLFNAQKTNE